MTIPSPILLLSPDGMLGQAFARLLRERGATFTGVSYPEFDITSASSIESVVDRQFRLVINCCAFTAVDLAEDREAEAQAINGDGVGLLAARCKQIGALLVHYSTDYVFDGRASRPYPVDASRLPQNAYGRSKARGEELIEASGCECLLIRTSWLYAPWGKNFVDTMARLGATKPIVRVVDDQRGRPTSAEYLAERSMALVNAGARGTFHVTDGGECTWFEFAKAIVESTGGAARVEPCTTADFPTPASRPAYSVLDLGSTERMIGESRPWPANLANVLQQRTARTS